MAGVLLSIHELLGHTIIILKADGDRGSAIDPNSPGDANAAHHCRGDQADRFEAEQNGRANSKPNSIVLLMPGVMPKPSQSHCSRTVCCRLVWQDGSHCRL